MHSPLRSPALLVVPSLLVIASAAHGASFQVDEGLKLNIKGYLQTQIALGADGEAPTASGATGVAAESSYDVLRGQTGENDAVAFNIRRARLAFEAKYGTGWRGLLVIRGDENDDPRGQNSDRKLEVYRAFTAYGFESGAYFHEFKLGLDLVFAGDAGPSAAYCLPFERPAATAVGAAYGSSTADGVTVHRNFDGRQTGVAYFASGGWFNFGVDLANGTSPDENRDSYSYGEANGQFIGARLELAPNKDMMPSARNESFVGAEGTHVVLGFDYGIDMDMHSSQPDLSAAGPYDFASYDYEFYGPDLCFHWNAVTAIADLKFVNSTEEGYTLDAAGTKTGIYGRTANGMVWDIRAAWAFPLSGKMVIEPAIGFGIADYDTDADEEGAAPSRILSDDTNLDSGTTFDIGGSLYFNKHINKLTVGYRHWQGEDPPAGQSGTPKAQVFVIQHQLQF